MNYLREKVPGYLLGKYQLIATVTFTSLFAIVFVLLTYPWRTNSWFAVGNLSRLGLSAVFFFAAFGVIVASKRTMYILGKSKAPMTYGHYISWCVLEVFLISAIYAFITTEGTSRGVLPDFGETYADALQRSFVFSLFCLGLPYLLAGMYFAIVDKNNTIRVMNYSTVVSDEVVQPKDENKITLFDSNGMMKMSISSSNLFYIESDDNYIIVWYTDGQEALKQYMLRCRLKTVEESFLGTNLMRCHRKYIVNMEKVRVLRKERDGYIIELENELIKAIPISKTYEEKVLARFNSTNK